MNTLFDYQLAVERIEAEQKKAELYRLISQQPKKSNLISKLLKRFSLKTEPQLKRQRSF